MAIPLRAALDEARRAPIPTDSRSAEPMRHGAMVLRYYAPQGTDPRTPRDQDDIHIVASGRGDARFAPAGAERRFGEFSGDFDTRVMFYGPKGGENG